MSGEFVARMEALLDLYNEERDSERPVVCFDETSKQLIEDAREPIGAEPDGWSVMTTSTSERARATCSCSANPKEGGDMWRLPRGAPRWTSPIR